MLAKCNCNNCSAHLEFESEGAGNTIICPKCGIETLLYIPAHPVDQTVHSPRKFKSLPLKITLICVGAALTIALGFLIYRYSGQIMPPLARVLGGTFAAVVFIVVAAVVCVWAFLWIIFPVFVYMQLDQVIKLLRLIERNTRR